MNRRRSLYRTVLGIAVAALVAAWLPFSVLYINTLSRQAATVAHVAIPTAAGTTQQAQPLTPVTTRVSGVVR